MCFDGFFAIEIIDLKKSNIYVDTVTEFRNNNIAIYTCVATPCLINSPR